MDCNPTDAFVQYSFAYYYITQKQEDLALEALEKALELGIEKEILNKNNSFCDILKKDFKNFKFKSELEILLIKYKVFCKPVARRLG
jgi:hypothetical protein